MNERLAELVVECTERIEREGIAALDAMCAEHAELAAALREAIGELLGCGLIDGQAGAEGDFDDFVLVRELGRGGMGVVHEAVQKSLGRRVALKMLHAHLQLDNAAIERFRREATTAGGLNHRGIAQVFAIGAQGTRQFLAMELVDGAPLDRVIGILRGHTVGSLDADSVRRALQQVCGGELPPGPRGPEKLGHAGTIAVLVAEIAEALAFAHERGIVHRDVKPLNVMLRRDGSAVLTDFGLARRDDLPSMTRSGVFAGTPFYASPEQAAGLRAVDERSDVFSLGATLYELLTLQLPFRGASSDEVLLAIRQREPVDPRRHHRSLPTDLVAVLQKALEKQPELRYATAAALAADLRAFAGFRPTLARPITALGRLRRWMRRQPLHAALAGTLSIGLPLVGGLGIVVWRNQDMVAAARQQQLAQQIEQAVQDGFVAAGDGRFEEAVAAMRHARTLDPDCIEAWAGAALASLELGAPAMQEWAHSIAARQDLLGRSRTLQRALANVRRELGDTESAEAALRQLGEPREPLESFWVGMNVLHRAIRTADARAIQESYGHLLDAVIGSRTTNLVFVYHLGVAAGEARDEDGARRAARTLQRLWPESARAWTGVALALHHIDPEAAIPAYERALQLETGDGRARLSNNLANALRQVGRESEALALWRQILEELPDYAIAHTNLGRSLFYRGEVEAALHHLLAATRAAPREVVAQHYLVWALQRLGRPDEALRAAESAVAILPESATMHRSLAKCLAGADRLDEALAAAERAVALGESDPDGHALLAQLRLRAGDIDGARRSHRRRIECCAPGDRQRAQEDFTDFLMRDGKQSPREHLEEALAIARELVDGTGGKDPWSMAVLAKVRFLCGEPEQALRCVGRVLELTDGATDPETVRLRNQALENQKTIARSLERDGGR